MKKINKVLYTALLLVALVSITTLLLKVKFLSINILTISTHTHTYIYIHIRITKCTYVVKLVYYTQHGVETSTTTYQSRFAMWLIALLLQNDRAVQMIPCAREREGEKWDST